MREPTDEDREVIAEVVPLLLRDLDRCRRRTMLAAVTGHLQAGDGEVLITVRDGSASVLVDGRAEDITPLLGDEVS